MPTSSTESGPVQESAASTQETSEKIEATKTQEPSEAQETQSKLTQLKQIGIKEADEITQLETQLENGTQAKIDALNEKLISLKVPSISSDRETLIKQNMVDRIVKFEEKKSEECTKLNNRLVQKDERNPKEVISEKFIQPYTEAEKNDYSETYKKAITNPEAVKILEKKLSENIEFVAYKTEKRFGDTLLFRITKNDDVKAQLSFNPEKGNVFNMVHREVQSHDIGINGSTMLKKVEEYFSVLQDSEALPPEITFALEVGQTSVAQWAMKNGYTFKDAKQEQLFKSIREGKDPEKYIVTNIGDGTLFDSYIFEKDVYQNHKKEMEEDPSLAKKYSLRLELIKQSTKNNTKTVPHTNKAPYK